MLKERDNNRDNKRWRGRERTLSLRNANNYNYIFGSSKQDFLLNAQYQKIYCILDLLYNFIWGTLTYLQCTVPLTVTSQSQRISTGWLARINNVTFTQTTSNQVVTAREVLEQTNVRSLPKPSISKHSTHYKRDTNILDLYEPVVHVAN